MPTDEVTKCQVSDVVNAASVMPVLEVRWVAADRVIKTIQLYANYGGPH